MSQIEAYECCGRCKKNNNRWVKCSELPHIAINGECIDLEEHEPFEGEIDEDYDQGGPFDDEYNDPFWDEY
jgi:hypothetical protein